MKTLRDKFQDFHEKNPHIYSALERMSLESAANGQRTGISKIVEELRWNSNLSTKDDNSPFKINNSYRAFYTRLLIERHPQLITVLETRAQKSND
jgi:hypothetical protein